MEGAAPRWRPPLCWPLSLALLLGLRSDRRILQALHTQPNNAVKSEGAQLPPQSRAPGTFPQPCAGPQGRRWEMEPSVSVSVFVWLREEQVSSWLPSTQVLYFHFINVLPYFQFNYKQFMAQSRAPVIAANHIFERGYRQELSFAEREGWDKAMRCVLLEFLHPAIWGKIKKLCWPSAPLSLCECT